MPPYAHTVDEKIDLTLTNRKLSAMRSVGVPYTPSDIDGAERDAREQGEAVVKDLATEGVRVESDRQIVALIAYIQRLGKKTELKRPGGSVAAAENGGAK